MALYKNRVRVSNIYTYRNTVFIYLLMVKTVSAGKNIFRCVVLLYSSFPLTFICLILQMYSFLSHVCDFIKKNCK